MSCRSALVIDDNPVRRTVVVNTLTLFGLKVYAVNTRSEGIGICEEHRNLDLVAMRLGNHDEVSANITARNIRSIQLDREPFIVGMSPHTIPHDAVFSSEMDAVCLWPFNGKKSIQDDINMVINMVNTRNMVSLLDQIFPVGAGGVA